MIDLPIVFVSKVLNMVFSHWISIIGSDFALVRFRNWFGADSFSDTTTSSWGNFQTISNKSSQPGVNYVESFTTLLIVNHKKWMGPVQPRFNLSISLLMMTDDSRWFTADQRLIDISFVTPTMRWSADQNCIWFCTFIHPIVGFTSGRTIKTSIVVVF